MKKYKLLKDLPFAKAGEIFESRILNDGKEYMFWGEIKTEKIENFDEWFEEIKEPKLYFTIDFFLKEIAKISEKEIMGYAIDNVKSLGLLFGTREEAEKYLEYLEAKEIIRQDSKDFNPDWNDYDESKYYGYWDFKEHKPDWGISYMSKGANIYFKRFIDIDKSFREHPKEWETYLTYGQ